MVGFGVLDSKDLVVPGTVQMYDDPERALHRVESHDSRRYKHSASGVILNPQPSDSPDDPLNWPRTQRYYTFFIACIWVSLALAHMAILGPVTVDLATKYDKSIAAIGNLTSDLFLVTSVASYALSALSRKYGKRGLFIVCGTISMVADIWAAKAGSYESLRGARILSGIGCSMFECVGITIIGDLLFVHERARGIAVFVFAMQAGGSASPSIMTQVITRWGIERAWWGLAATEAFLVILMIFTFQEPVFLRGQTTVLAHDRTSTPGAAASAVETQDRSNTQEKGIVADHHETNSSDNSSDQEAVAIPPAKTYMQKLKPFDGNLSKDNVFAIFLRTLALTFHPTVFFVAICGIIMASVAGPTYTIAQILVPPPYNFTAEGIANLYLASIVGGLVNTPICATLDPLIKWMSKRNGMVYEPEFRLLYCWPGLIIWLVGWVGWGWGAAVQMHWFGYAGTFFTFILGMAIVSASLTGYIFDAYAGYVNECQVILFVVKNFWSFAMGYFWVDWCNTAGQKTVYGISGGYTALLILGTVPLYIYGKRIRAFWARHPYFGIKDMASSY